MSPSTNSKRIVKNTMMLYTRQILILFVGLYTVRVVLDELGVEDYGIYSVVGGIVSLFSFLSSAMASATQRFFSYALGQKNLENLKKTFSVNWVIYVSIAVIAFFLLETVGLWFVDAHLQLPSDRFESARFLYHFSVFSFIATIFTTPFMAIIIAHEDMQIYAYVSIVEAILKLGIVFLIQFLPGDKLEIYGVLVFFVAVATSAIYFGICLVKYQECQFRVFYWDRRLINEVIEFTGWTLFGQVSNVARIQAVTILLNQSFNPMVVAARAIAINVTNKIKLFSNNFNIGLYPPIIKSYAANNKEELFSLIFNGSKVTFFLMWIFALPLFIEMEIILNIWLKNVPAEATLFTRLALVEVLINTLSLPMATAARAPGRMKVYELSLGSIQIAIFFVSWLVLRLGEPAYSVFVVAMLANAVMLIVRLLIVSSIIGFSMKLFLLRVVLPVVGVVLFSSIPSLVLQLYLPHGIAFSLTSILSCIVFSCTSMYYIGLDKVWREKVNQMVFTRIRKILK